MSAVTILLTGATGFLGSHLLKALLENGYKVVILKRSNSNCWRISHLMNKVLVYDIDLQPLELAFKENKINVVIHTACNYGRKGNDLTGITEANITFGLRILDACLKYKTNTFINTDTILDKKINAYALSKKQFLEWLKTHSKEIQIVNLKLEHMYGQKDDDSKLAPWLLSEFEAGASEIDLTKGEQQRDFIYIDDVVFAYLIILKKISSLSSFSEFDVGTGMPISVRSFIEQLKEIFENKFGKIETKLNFGVIPYRENEPMSIKISNQPLIELGWVANTKLNKGLEKILNDINDDQT